MSVDCVKKYNTHPFPEDDTSYLKLFDIDRYNKKYWLYKTIEGWTIKGVIRHINKDGSKRIFQFSYDGNKFVNVTKHIKDCPPLHADELQKLDKDHPIRFGEGEKVAKGLNDAFKASLAEDEVDPAGIVITGLLGIGSLIGGFLRKSHHPHFVQPPALYPYESFSVQGGVA